MEAPWLLPGVEGLTLPVKRRLAARLWHHTHPPRLGEPSPPHLQERRLGVARKLAAHSMRHHRSQVGMGASSWPVFAHVPTSMWGAMAGTSPYKAIFLQDTALDMNLYEMIVAPLDVQGAFPHAQHLLSTEVWVGMGLPFLPFTAGYIQTRLYAVITAAGLTPWTSTDSGVPQGCTEGFFFYLLVTLPLAFELARVYPVYDGYLLRSPLIDFADGKVGR